MEFGATVTGIDPSLVLATFDNGNPGIIASVGTPIPVPGTLLLLGSGLAALAAAKEIREIIAIFMWEDHQGGYVPRTLLFF